MNSLTEDMASDMGEFLESGVSDDRSGGLIYGESEEHTQFSDKLFWLVVDACLAL